MIFLRWKNPALFVALSILVLLPQAAFGYGSNSWDPMKLDPVSSADQFRALFSPLSFYSVNDDYSFQVSGNVQALQSLLVPCSKSEVPDRNFNACISNVQYREIGKANWQNGSLSETQLSEFPTNTIKGKSPNLKVGTFPYQPDKFIPQGGIASIWDLPGAKHNLGSKYLVRATFNTPGADVVSQVDGGLQLLFRLQLVPISYNATSNTISQDQYSVEDFNSNYEFKIHLNLGVFIKSISGWYFNRLENPDFYSNAPEGFLEISGQPVKIPLGISGVMSTAAAKDLIGTCAPNIYCGHTGMIYSRYASFSAEEKVDPSALSLFEGTAGGIKTVATISRWSIDSTRLSEVIDNGTTTSDCLQNLHGKGARVFLGSVSSNATLFQTTPPTWDPEEKSFSFKVAAPHLDEASKPNRGTYTLAIPLDQAKCRWGSDALAPKAEVQVVNEDGTSKISTAVSQVKNGLLVFNISGFGYSSPTIKIRMNSKIIASEAPSSIKITCIKGKLTKVVSSSTCPAGYKKK